MNSTKLFSLNMVRILVATLLIGIITVVIGTHQSHAEAQRVTIEESNLAWSPSGTVYNDTAASGGKAIKLTKNTTGTITGPTNVITEVRVTVKADLCNEAPKMQIKLNNVVVATQDVNNTSWTDYSFPVNVPAGNNKLQISFTNEFSSYWLWMTLCVRGLHVDKATLVTETPTTPSPSPSPTPTTSPTPTVTPSPSPTPSPNTIPEGAEYVAMGDSYSSGWGADRTPSNLTSDNTVYGNTYNTCGRSNKAAQVLVAQELKLSLKNVACGGANTDNLLTTGQAGEPAQLNNLTSNTKLITMTIGGNDSALMWMLQVCVMNGDCWRNGNWLIENFIAQTDTKIAALPAKVENVLRTAIQKSPDAKIRQAGYPYIIAAPGESRGTCAAWLSTSEQAYFTEATIQTNNAIKGAVEKVARETGKDIKYVDPLAADSPFMQRDGGQMLDGCSTSLKRYMNGTNDGNQGSWHPNNLGQRMYADIYKASL